MQAGDLLGLARGRRKVGRVENRWREKLGLPTLSRLPPRKGLLSRASLVQMMKMLALGEMTSVYLSIKNLPLCGETSAP